jgi:hypothetical protein
MGLNASIASGIVLQVVFSSSQVFLYVYGITIILPTKTQNKTFVSVTQRMKTRKDTAHF